MAPLPPYVKRTDNLAAAVAVGTAGLFVTVTAIWGGRLNAQRGMHLDAAPLYGRWQPRFGSGAIAALLVGALVIWGVPALYRFPWRKLLAACGLIALAWGVALATVDGHAGLTRGVSGPHGHLVILNGLPPPAEFIETFVERIADYTVHVRGHPPGVELALWFMDRVGLAGPLMVAGLLIAIGATTPVAVLIAAREIAGETLARRAAPFLVLAPTAIWMVTTFDALYCAIGAWGIALLVGACARSGVRSAAAAAGGGLVLAGGLFASYGLILVGIIPLAVALRRRRFDVLVVAALPVLAAVLLFGAYGFWWWDGLLATRHEYLAGISSARPYVYFLFANLAVAVLAVGLASVAGLLRLKNERVAWLVVPALAALLLADISGMSKGEVERIWLPFFPWVVLAAGGLGVEDARWWLTAQVIIVVAMQSLLYIPW